MENNISNADVVTMANSSISLANDIMVTAGVFVGVVTLLVAFFTYLQNNKNKTIIEEARDKILTKIIDDERMRDDLIDKIANDLIAELMNNENFRKELKIAVIGDIINTINENKQEQSNIGCLE